MTSAGRSPARRGPGHRSRGRTCIEILEWVIFAFPMGEHLALGPEVRVQNAGVGLLSEAEGPRRCWSHGSTRGQHHERIADLALDQTSSSRARMPSRARRLPA
jgi:hypothetical protein